MQCDGSNGACWEYDSKRMALNVFITSWVLKSLSTISFFLAWYTYVPSSPDADKAIADLEAAERGQETDTLAMAPLEEAAVQTGSEDDALETDALGSEA